MENVMETKVGDLKGKMNCEVLDFHGVDPTQIIDINDGFHLSIGWSLTGQLVPMLAGTWHVIAYLESIGPGFEGEIYHRDVPFVDGATTNAHELKYSFTSDHIDVPNLKDPDGQKLAPGPYKLVTVLTCTNKDDHPGSLASFVEGPILQFYVS